MTMMISTKATSDILIRNTRQGYFGIPVLFCSRKLGVLLEVAIFSYFSLNAKSR